MREEKREKNEKKLKRTRNNIITDTNKISPKSKTYQNIPKQTKPKQNKHQKHHKQNKTIKITKTKQKIEQKLSISNKKSKTSQINIQKTK